MEYYEKNKNEKEYSLTLIDGDADLSFFGTVQEVDQELTATASHPALGMSQRHDLWFFMSTYDHGYHGCFYRFANMTNCIAGNDANMYSRVTNLHFLPLTIAGYVNLNR